MNLTKLLFNDHWSFSEQDSHKNKRDQPTDGDNNSDEDYKSTKGHISKGKKAKL